MYKFGLLFLKFSCESLPKFKQNFDLVFISQDKLEILFQHRGSKKEEESFCMGIMKGRKFG